jgi:hypothetical protein
MCMIRHSAARPHRYPPIRINHAQNQPFGYDWNIRSATDADALDPGDADAWIRDAVANENDGLKRSGLCRYLFSVLILKRALPR